MRRCVEVLVQVRRLLAREGNWAQISLPSGEIRRIPSSCRATIGKVGNSEHSSIVRLVRRDESVGWVGVLRFVVRQ